MTEFRKMESARIAFASIDEKYIWFIDDVYGGIYRCEKNGEVAECMVDAAQLYQGNLYLIAGMVSCNNQILLIPQDFEHPIIIYEKKQNIIRFKYKKNISHKVAGVLCNGKEILLIPTVTLNPLYIIDIHNFQDDIVRNEWFERCDNETEIWECNSIKDWGYFVLRDTSFIIKSSSKNYRTFHTIELKDGEKISSAYIHNDIWVLPIRENCIKKYTKEGNLLKKIDISNYGKAENYVRIVCVEKYVILLPGEETDLLIYNMQNNKIIMVDVKGMFLENTLKNKKRQDIAYWEYYTNESELCLLPLNRKMFRFNLHSESFFYSDLVLNKEGVAECQRKREIVQDIEAKGYVEEETNIDISIFIKNI